KTKRSQLIGQRVEKQIEQFGDSSTIIRMELLFPNCPEVSSLQYASIALGTVSKIRTATRIVVIVWNCSRESSMLQQTVYTTDD
ncbi:hypothetical protein PENTCL1PPCAC_21104, partial [Pristionchus entomophagus]